MKDTLLAQLNNAYTCFQRSTGSLAEEDSSFTPVEGTFTVAGHVGQTINWFIQGAFRPDGFAMDFPANEQKIRAVTSLAEAKDWIRRAIENARQAIENKSQEEWAPPVPPGPVMGGLPRLQYLRRHHRPHCPASGRLDGLCSRARQDASQSVRTLGGAL